MAEIDDSNRIPPIEYEEKITKISGICFDPKDDESSKCGSKKEIVEMIPITDYSTSVPDFSIRALGMQGVANVYINYNSGSDEIIFTEIENKLPNDKDLKARLLPLDEVTIPKDKTKIIRSYYDCFISIYPDEFKFDDYDKIMLNIDSRIDYTSDKIKIELTTNGLVPDYETTMSFGQGLIDEVLAGVLNGRFVVANTSGFFDSKILVSSQPVEYLIFPIDDNAIQINTDQSNCYIRLEPAELKMSAPLRVGSKTLISKGVSYRYSFARGQAITPTTEETSITASYGFLYNLIFIIPEGPVGSKRDSTKYGGEFLVKRLTDNQEEVYMYTLSTVKFTNDDENSVTDDGDEYLLEIIDNSTKEVLASLEYDESAEIAGERDIILKYLLN